MLLVPVGAILAARAWVPAPPAVVAPAPSAATAPPPPPEEDRTPEIRGRILDADGNPVNGAAVRLVSPSLPYTVYADARSDAAGRFSFAHVGLERVRVVADHDPGGAVTSAELRVAQGQTTELTLVLSPASAVHGTVVDSEDHAVAGATIFVEGVPWIVPSATSDADGAFRLGVVPNGVTSLVAVARGYKSARVSLPRRDDPVELVVHVRLEAGPAALGDVRDPDGNPIRARVVACEGQPAEASAVSAEDGTFELPASAIGCAAVAQHDEYEASDAVVLVEGRRVELRLRPGGSIEGVVLDDTGAAIPSFTVGVESFSGAQSRSLRSTPPRKVDDARGAFRLEKLAPGRYVLTAGTSGKPPGRSDPIDVAGGIATTGDSHRPAAGRHRDRTRLRRAPRAARGRRAPVRRREQRRRQQRPRHDRRRGTVSPRGRAGRPLHAARAEGGLPHSHDLRAARRLAWHALAGHPPQHGRRRRRPRVRRHRREPDADARGPHAERGGPGRPGRAGRPFRRQWEPWRSTPRRPTACPSRMRSQRLPGRSRSHVCVSVHRPKTGKTVDVTIRGRRDRALTPVEGKSRRGTKTQKFSPPINTPFFLCVSASLRLLRLFSPFSVRAQARTNKITRRPPSHFARAARCHRRRDSADVRLVRWPPRHPSGSPRTPGIPLDLRTHARVPVSEVDDIVQSALAEALAAERAPEDDDENSGLGPRDRAPARLINWYRHERRESPQDPQLAETVAATEIAAQRAQATTLRWATRELPGGDEHERTFEWMLREGAGEKLESIAAEEELPGAARTAARLAASKTLRGAMGGGDRRAPGPCDGRLPRAPQAAEGGDRAAAVALPGAERGAAAAAAAGESTPGDRAGEPRRDDEKGPTPVPSTVHSTRGPSAVPSPKSTTAPTTLPAPDTDKRSWARPLPQKTGHNKPESMSDAPMPDEPAPEK